MVSLSHVGWLTREEINVNVKKLEIDDLARRVAYAAVLIHGFGSCGHRGPAASREHRVGRGPRGQRGSGGDRGPPAAPEGSRPPGPQKPAPRQTLCPPPQTRPSTRPRPPHPPE